MLVCLSVTAIKPFHQNQLGEERGLFLPGRLQSFTEGCQGRSWLQKAGGAAACPLPRFLTHSRPTVVPCPHQLAIKKTETCPKASLMEEILQPKFLPLRCVKLKSKISGHEGCPESDLKIHSRGDCSELLVKKLGGRSSRRNRRITGHRVRPWAGCLRAEGRESA